MEKNVKITLDIGTHDAIIRTKPIVKKQNNTIVWADEENNIAKFKQKANDLVIYERSGKEARVMQIDIESLRYIMAHVADLEKIEFEMFYD